MKDLFNKLFNKKVLAFMFILFLIGVVTLYFPYGDGGGWFSIAAIVLLVIVFGGVWYYEKRKGRDYFEDFKKKK
jgi:hypothetical protein